MILTLWPLVVALGLGIEVKQPASRFVVAAR